MGRPLCIYHANCADGFCAAWIWRKYAPFGATTEFLPANYGQSPAGVEDRDVAILDFSWPREILLQMKESAANLIVLDHHKTAQASLAGLDFCRFDMSKSGARMTWEYLSPPVPIPWLVDYTEDRDLWLWKQPHSREINSALRSYPFAFEAWDALDGRELAELQKEGEAIQRAERQIIDNHVRNAQEIVILGHKVLCVNATTQISEIAGELAKDRPFAACWFETDKNDRVFSLRSREGGIDVSEIAKRYGGGGHAHAASFTVPATGATGIFTDGKSGDDDEGEIKMAIAADHNAGLVRIEFGKEVGWLGLPKAQADAFGRMIVDKAKQL